MGMNKREVIKMKTNILVGVTMSLLLLALPAAASDYTLGIFGNANEDDTVNMQDVTYTELIILEYRDRTELADAKYDGDIDILDMTQIALIILGREKELTILDSADGIVTVNKPIEKVVGRLQAAEAIKILKAEDKMVGVENLVKDREVFFPELSKLPLIGTMSSPDYERIVELEPDIVIWTCSFVPELETTLEPAGIVVVRLDLYRPATIIEDMRKLGYILDKGDEADEFIDWYNGYIDTIKQQTDTLSEDDKPRVYFEMFWDYMTFTRNYGPDTMITIAGGRNIAADLGDPDKSVTVDKEWVMEQNPEIIIKAIHGVAHGYEVDDPSEMKAVRDAILNRPELAETTAITTERVHLFPWGHLVVTPRGVSGTAYMAKWLHPELFEDMDPQAIHQEYLDRFMRIDYDLDEHGVFVYPPLEG